MNVVVLLFGPQAELAGARELLLEVPPALTIGALRHHLSQAEPRLAASLPSSRFALNHEFVQDDAVVQESDEIALIGMVSGG